MSSAATGTTPTPKKQGTKSNAPPPPPIPPDPLMGSCEETYTGSKKYYYVFGGKPKPDWSGLQANQTTSVSDLCYRTLDPVAGQKGAVIRTTGLEKKFETKASLSDFLGDIWEHLVKFGLETIAYLPDPRNPTKVLNAVKQHAQFTGDMSLAETLLNLTNGTERMTQKPKIFSLILCQKQSKLPSNTFTTKKLKVLH